MPKKEAIQLFEERKVRSVWDDEREEWFFSVVDVVAVLTGSADSKQYTKKMKARNEILKSKICPILGDKNFQVESYTTQEEKR